MFSLDKREAITSYQAFVAENIVSCINFSQGGKDQRIIGNEAFIEKISMEEKDIERQFSVDLITQAACQVLSVSKDQLYGRNKRRQIIFARNIIGYVNKHYGEKSLIDLAKEFSWEPSALGKAINRIESSRDEQFMKITVEIVVNCQMYRNLDFGWQINRINNLSTEGLVNVESREGQTR